MDLIIFQMIQISAKMDLIHNFDEYTIDSDNEALVKSSSYTIVEQSSPNSDEIIDESQNSINQQSTESIITENLTEQIVNIVEIKEDLNNISQSTTN